MAEMPLYCIHPVKETPDFDYARFKTEVFNLTHIDLNLYKENQMKRRINTLIIRVGCEGYEDYTELIKNDREKLDFFVGYITINVTEFFRNPDHWNLLNEQVVPRLMESAGPTITAWSAACSTGEEPYTIAMCLSRHLPLSNIRVIATDIDEKVLATAAAGEYSEAAVESIPSDLLQRFFTKTAKGYQVTQELKDCIEFRKMDLLQEDYPQGCHLIVCRNVLIYFTTEAKEVIYQKLQDALPSSGCLFLGHTEQIINWKKTPLQRMRPCFYFKR